jgi:hypothetical protein
VSVPRARRGRHGAPRWCCGRGGGNGARRSIGDRPGAREPGFATPSSARRRSRTSTGRPACDHRCQPSSQVRASSSGMAFWRAIRRLTPAVSCLALGCGAPESRGRLLPGENEELRSAAPPSMLPSSVSLSQSPHTPATTLRILGKARRQVVEPVRAQEGTSREAPNRSTLTRRSTPITAAPSQHAFPLPLAGTTIQNPG